LWEITSILRGSPAAWNHNFNLIGVSLTKPRFPKPHRVSVSFGAPVSRRTLAAAGEGQDEAERVSDGLHRRLAALLEELSR
jgi:hypothetical protein